MVTIAEAYVLNDSQGVESILVVRTDDIDLLHTLVRRMARMRDERIRKLGRDLERELNERNE